MRARGMRTSVAGSIVSIVWRDKPPGCVPSVEVAGSPSNEKEKMTHLSSRMTYVRTEPSATKQTSASRCPSSMMTSLRACRVSVAECMSRPVPSSESA